MKKYFDVIKFESLVLFIIAFYLLKTYPIKRCAFKITNFIQFNLAHIKDMFSTGYVLNIF